MHISEIAKLAAGITAGTLTYEVVRDQLDPEHHSTLDALLAGGAGVVGGSIATEVVGDILDDTGLSDMLDGDD